MKPPKTQQILTILTGTLILGFWGSLLGAITGWTMAWLLNHSLLSEYAWIWRGPNLPAQFAENGLTLALVVGLLGLSISIWHNSRLIQYQSLLSLLRSTLKYSLIGIAVGVVNGPPLGALVSCKLLEYQLDISSIYWLLPPWFAPPSMIAAEGALNGYLWGIALGFTGGTLFALYQASQTPDSTP